MIYVQQQISFTLPLTKTKLSIYFLYNNIKNLHIWVLDFVVPGSKNVGPVGFGGSSVHGVGMLTEQSTPVHPGEHTQVPRLEQNWKNGSILKCLENRWHKSCYNVKVAQLQPIMVQE